MEVKYIKKGKKNSYQITLETKEEITIYDDIIVKYALIPKKKITEKELEAIKKENKTLESYYKALEYLTFRLRTQKEMEKYLTRYNYEKEDIKKTIEKLKKEGYLNEEEYINCYINDTFRFSNDGPYKIKKKLIDLGCTSEKIEMYLNQLPKEDWLAKLEKNYQKKVKSKHSEGIEKWRQKCNNYFYTLGYPKEWIEEIATEIDFPEDYEIFQKEYEKLHRKWSKKYTGKELELQIQRKMYAKGFSKERIISILMKENG